MYIKPCVAHTTPRHPASWKEDVKTYKHVLLYDGFYFRFAGRIERENDTHFQTISIIYHLKLLPFSLIRLHMNVSLRTNALCRTLTPACTLLSPIYTYTRINNLRCACMNQQYFWICWKQKALSSSNRQTNTWHSCTYTRNSKQIKDGKRNVVAFCRSYFNPLTFFNRQCNSANHPIAKNTTKHIVERNTYMSFESGMCGSGKTSRWLYDMMNVWWLRVFSTLEGEYVHNNGGSFSRMALTLAANIKTYDLLLFRHDFITI